MVGVCRPAPEAADLPQPSYVTVSQTSQQIDMQFARQAGQHAGHHPLGAAVRQRHDQAARTTASAARHLVTATFDYYGIAVTAYAYIPAAPASN